MGICARAFGVADSGFRWIAAEDPIFCLGFTRDPACRYPVCGLLGGPKYGLGALLGSGETSELPFRCPGGKTYAPVSTTVLTSLVVLR